MSDPSPQVDETPPRPKTSHGRKFRAPFTKSDDDSSFAPLSSCSTEANLPQQQQPRRGHPLDNTSVPVNHSNRNNQNIDNGKPSNPEINRRRKNAVMTAPAIKHASTTATSAAKHRTASTPGDTLTRLPPASSSSQKKPRKNLKNDTVDLVDSNSDTDGETCNPTKKNSSLEGFRKSVSTIIHGSPVKKVIDNFVSNVVSNTSSDNVPGYITHLQKTVAGRGGPHLAERSANNDLSHQVEAASQFCKSASDPTNHNPQRSPNQNFNIPPLLPQRLTLSKVNNNTTTAKDTNERKRKHAAERKISLQASRAGEPLPISEKATPINLLDDDENDDRKMEENRNRKEFSSDEEGDNNDDVLLSSLAGQATQNKRAPSNNNYNGGQKRRGSKTRYNDDLVSDSEDEAPHRASKQPRKDNNDNNFWSDITSPKNDPAPNGGGDRRDSLQQLPRKRLHRDDGSDIDDPSPIKQRLPTPNFRMNDLEDNLQTQCAIEESSESAKKKKKSSFDGLPKTASKLGLSKQNNSKKKNVANDSARRKKPKGKTIIPGAATAASTTKPNWLEREQEHEAKNSRKHSSKASPPLARTQTGRKRQKAKKQKELEEIVSLLSSDSEQETPAKKPAPAARASPAIQSPPLTPEPEETVILEVDDSAANVPGERYELSCIAIGSLIRTKGCQLVHDNDTGRLYMLFHEIADGKQITKRVTVPFAEPGNVSVKIYMNNGGKECVPESGTFLSMNLSTTPGDDLSKFQEYDPQSLDDGKKYIVFEFPTWTMAARLRTELAHCGFGNLIFLDDKLEEVKKYSKSLFDYNERKRQLAAKQKKKTPKSPPETEWQDDDVFFSPRRRQKSPPRNPYKGKPKDEILLVYPFAGDKDKIEEAAKGLQEASRLSLIEEDEPDNPNSDTPPKKCDAAMTGNGALSNNSAAAAGTQRKGRRRKHFVTLRIEDYERLDPLEWLNDSLVDFWMQWISRDDTDISSSPTHFFTSHFYTVLAEQGPEAVQSWTAKKGINIFEKKMIFIPVNKDLHWSLCVVVNPGAINLGDDPPAADANLSCLIFMDSLRMHNKQKVKKNIVKWLNSEYGRLESAIGGVENPFHSEHFVLFSPKVPYQNNTWDCGVFICRYAYAMYQLRRKNFTYQDAGLGGGEDTPKKTRKNGAFYHLITRGDEFNFDMEDIARFRIEFKILIEKLSVLFLDMKEVEKEERRQQRNAGNKAEDEKENAMVVAGPTKAVTVLEERKSDPSQVQSIVETNHDGANDFSSTAESQLPSSSGDEATAAAVETDKVQVESEGVDENAVAERVAEARAFVEQATSETVLEHATNDRNENPIGSDGTAATTVSERQTGALVQETNSKRPLANYGKENVTYESSHGIVDGGVQTEGSSSSESGCFVEETPPEGPADDQPIGDCIIDEDMAACNEKTICI